MIPPRHGGLSATLYGFYAAAALRRRLSTVWIRGSLPNTRSPLLVAVRHVGPCDPMLLFHLTRVRFGGRHFVLTDTESLRRSRLLRQLGAFAVDPSSRASTLAALRFALARLSEPNARVWVVPEGGRSSTDARPLECAPGAAWLAARARVPAVAVALRYERDTSDLQHAFVSFSEPRMVDSARGDADPIAAMLTLEADRLRDVAASGDRSELDVVVRGRR